MHSILTIAEGRALDGVVRASIDEGMLARTLSVLSEAGNCVCVEVKEDSGKMLRGWPVEKSGARGCVGRGLEPLRVRAPRP